RLDSVIRSGNRSENFAVRREGKELDHPGELALGILLAHEPLFPVSTSQKRSVRSLLEEARILPSGEKAASFTSSEWPSNPRSLCIAISRSRITLSLAPHEAMSRPFGEKIMSKLSSSFGISSKRFPVATFQRRKVPFGVREASTLPSR